MAKTLELIIESAEVTPGVFKRQPFDYSSNESGIGLMSLRMEWPVTLEVEHDGLEGIKEGLQQILDVFGEMAFDFTISLLDKDKRRIQEEEF